MAPSGLLAGTLDTATNGTYFRRGSQSGEKLVSAALASRTGEFCLEGELISRGAFFCQCVKNVCPLRLRLFVEQRQSDCHILTFQRVFFVGVGAAREMVLQQLQNGQGDKGEYQPCKGNGVETIACGDAQTGNGPHACGSGQTLDGGTFPHDGTRPQKTDTGDYLRAEPCRVAAAILVQEHLPGDGYNTGTQGYQNMRAHTGGAVRVFSFGADDHTDDHGAQEPQTDLGQAGGQAEAIQDVRKHRWLLLSNA